MRVFEHISLDKIGHITHMKWSKPFANFDIKVFYRNVVHKLTRSVYKPTYIGFENIMSGVAVIGQT